MKTIRLLYPDYVSGGLDTYYLGARLMAQLLPSNESQPLIEVAVTPPDGHPKEITEGIYGKREVMAGIQDAMTKIEQAQPDRIITIGGNCMISQAPFDYLHGKYPDTGVIWIDAHPDVSVKEDGYPNAHAMVLGSLLGIGEKSLTSLRKYEPFKGEEILYVGLQPLHTYQRAFLEKAGVAYQIQSDKFLPKETIQAFVERFSHVVVHLDIDVLDPKFFHDTYFANPALVGDGSGGGKMTLPELGEILQLLDTDKLVGLTIAEYLPFEAERLHTIFKSLSLFTEK